MREKELRECSVCSFCGSKIGAGGPFFWRVKIERFVLNIQACQRQQGLGMLLGGHGGLAQIMGPDEDLAVELLKPITLISCEPCSLDSRPLVQFPEFEKEEEEKNELG